MKRDRGGIVLEGIPLPPSSNHQYVSFRRQGKIVHVRSKEYEYFRRSFDSWAVANKQGILVARDMVKNTGVEVEAFFGFHRDRLYTKKNEFKRLDVSNYLKGLHDCLAVHLEVDDRAFFSVVAEKFSVPDPLDEQVIVRLSPFQPRALSEIQGVIL